MLELFKNCARNYIGEDTNQDYKFYFDNGCQDEVISRLYVKHHNLLHLTASKYVGIDEATLTDIIVTQIWKCLSNYDETKSKGKIITMICTYVRNECRRYTEEQNTNKQKINQGHISTPFSAYDDPDRLDEMGAESGYDEVEMEQYLDKLSLSDNQRTFCKIVLDNQGTIKMSDVAREMKISRAGVLGIQRQLQSILTDIIK